MAGIRNEQELEFVVFCIENIAIRLNIGAKYVYEMLTEQSHILYNYIVPEYEMLHTQGKEYIINDILDVMREEGIKI